jgi:hypothetical protein
MFSHLQENINWHYSSIVCGKIYYPSISFTYLLIIAVKFAFLIINNI